MNRQQYLDFHRDCCDRMIEITKVKNADYAASDADPFFNFTRIEMNGVATTEQGFLTRMFDKFARLVSFSQKGFLEVKDESVEDTLLDLANYCILMAGYLRHKKEKKDVKENNATYFAYRPDGPNGPAYAVRVGEPGYQPSTHETSRCPDCQHAPRSPTEGRTGPSEGSQAPGYPNKQKGPSD